MLFLAVGQCFFLFADAVMIAVGAEDAAIAG